MSYTVEPIDVLKTPKERVIDPRSKKNQDTHTAYKWWLAESDKDLVAQLLSTTEYLKRTNLNRIRQASVFSRLLSGKPLYNFLASNATLDTSNQLPIGRPTANVCYSCTDTLVSRISQDRPKPVFLTDGGNYKERNLAKEANAFLQGELFRTKSYDKAALMLRDACMLGDGLLKVYAKDNKVAVDRVLETELLTDFNDAYYGMPRQLIQMKLVDRSVMMQTFPKAADKIAKASSGNVDSTPRSTETISDQFIIAEGWHLRSGDGAKDGRHSIVCSEGVLLDETEWDKDEFPFVKLGYNPNPVGWFSQGLVEILMPTQMEIYRMLIVASQAIELMGVPRIYLDQMSEIVETAFNNRIGTIIKGKGPNPPQFLNAQSNSPEIYQWIQWLIQNAFQMSGISAMAAASQKPAGLNSGEAIRSFDDLQTDRFAALSKRYQTVFTDLSYLIIDCASDIVEDTGKPYTTVHPGKDGTREIDFKAILNLSEYVVQVYEESSLPKDPAGRRAALSEMLAAGEITQQEFRRLNSFPDLEQSDQLAAALEERILYSLDELVEHGDKNYDKVAPDPWILDPSDLAITISTQYINRYKRLKLEEEKMQLLRDWQTQVITLKAQSIPPAMPEPRGATVTDINQAPATAPPAAPIGPATGVAV